MEHRWITLEQELYNKSTTWLLHGYITNHNLSQTQVVDLLVTGFTRMLHSWWEKHLIEQSRNKIKNVLKKDEDEIPIFDEHIGQGVPDAVNTLLFTII